MLSQTAEYALRSVVCLAAEPDSPVPVAELARRARVPASYLGKVLQMLARAGLVRSRRGLGGGFSLARDPAELSVLDVINAVEPLRRIRSCPLGIEAHGSRLCPLHRKLDEAIALVESAYASTSVSELQPEPRGCPALAADQGT